LGRYSGWIALHAGLAGGADAILIPEVPFDLSAVAGRLLERERWGAHFSIVVVAEGAYPLGGRRSIVEVAHEGRLERLGGIGAYVASELASLTRKETRTVSLGHLQRGGAPTSLDRLLATRFGAKALDLVVRGDFGMMVAFDPPAITSRPLSEIVGTTKAVAADSDLLSTAAAIGVTFGQPVAALATAPARPC
jgi:6-phosphofructokinase 1